MTNKVGTAVITWSASDMLTFCLLIAANCKMGFSKFLQCAFLCGSHLLQSASLDQRLNYEGDIVSRYAFSSSTFSPFVRLAFWKYVYTWQDRGGNASSWFSMIRELLSSGPTRCYATLWNKQIVILTGSYFTHLALLFESPTDPGAGHVHLGQHARSFCNIIISLCLFSVKQYNGPKVTVTGRNVTKW